MGRCDSRARSSWACGPSPEALDRNRAGRPGVGR
jgi:hypothetical protein